MPKYDVQVTRYKGTSQLSVTNRCTHYGQSINVALQTEA